MCPLKLFYCYAHEDRIFCQELDVHLAGLKRQQLLTTWYDGEIKAGAEWEQEINHHLSTADLIILFVSPHFLHSNYCYKVEMERALERHEAGTARVIPIIVRPAYWQGAPFSKLQLLPAKAQPVSRWSDRDEAWLKIVQEIYALVMDLRATLKTKLDQWLREGNALYDLKQYEEALSAYEHAIELNPTYAYAHRSRGWALYKLKRYEEALPAFERAIELDPMEADTYSGRGWTLYGLKHYEEALAAFERAIELDPTFAQTHRVRGWILYKLKRYEEALPAFKRAIELDPMKADTYAGRGWTLYGLERYEEALAAFERAIELDPTFAQDHRGRGWAFYKLERYEEALAAFEHAIELDSTLTDAYKGKQAVLAKLN